MTLALQGIRVLDLTDAISGPFTTMLLASCGAEVIRIESLRHLGFRVGGTGESPGFSQESEEVDFKAVDMSQLMSPVFIRFNLDKLSIALNLVKPEGKDIFKRLLKVSDVVVNNLSFGVMEKWGFDYHTLRQIKEDIIVVSMPPLGKGPHEQWTTWGMNLLSFTGFAYNWSHPETPMEERAATSTYGDYIASMKTASCILVALYHRARTGEGQYIEVSQAESTASVLGPSYLDYFVNNRISPPRGNRHPDFAPYGCYPCKGDDRWCVIAVFNENEWSQFCAALEFPKWAENSKFRDMDSRVRNADELDKNIEVWTRQHTPHQVMKILQSFGVAAGAVQNSEDLYYDLQLRARGHMIEIDAGELGNITFDSPPLHLSEGQKLVQENAPLLGEHNDYVYQQILGLTPQEVEQLIEKKVIF